MALAGVKMDSEKLADNILAKCNSGEEWICGVDEVTLAGKCTCAEIAHLIKTGELNGQ